LDELDKYIFVNRADHWRDLVAAGGLEAETAHRDLNAYLGYMGASKHNATTACIAFFNRLSEECIDPSAIKAEGDDLLNAVGKMYAAYRAKLVERTVPYTDFSLLQQEALSVLERNPNAPRIFRHVIVDEYQDTNTVQERIFFRLAAGEKNICVVGDDDQALYRFRGATVENFVRFPDRCSAVLGTKPREIPLDTNYRSRPDVVEFFGRFLQQCDWKRPKGGSYRVESKQIRAARREKGPAVVASAGAAPEPVAAEIASLVKTLVTTGRVTDPNQIAFLYPSLKSEQVSRMMLALEREGLRVYAPRANNFLETPEATAMLGLFAAIFGRPPRGPYQGDYKKYYDWVDNAEAVGQRLVGADQLLGKFVQTRRGEVEGCSADYQRLLELTGRRKWDIEEPYRPAEQKRALAECPGLSDQARRRIGSSRFNLVIDRRIKEGDPLKLKYVLKRATSLDWSILDLFYQLTLFEHFAAMFDAAQRGKDPDEGPVCNLALLTGYISRFMEQRAPTIAGDLLQDGLFKRLLFGSYLYALHRRGESEFEDAEDPFPKGRIPFLTIHQSKGLEFPVVVLGNPRKATKTQRMEVVVSPILPNSNDREPLDKMARFDTMRMFYVALSRAKNLLVVANFRSRGNYINDEFKPLVDALPVIANFDTTTVPVAGPDADASPRVYSYTGDFLAYKRCPRQYLIFRKFDFVPSRSQTMVFGTLVHRTLDDLHQLLISSRQQGAAVQ
jgi:DNA helicase II / ATP-dependent DNA helicase PcrA